MLIMNTKSHSEIHLRLIHHYLTFLFVWQYHWNHVVVTLNHINLPQITQEYPPPVVDKDLSA